MQYNDIISLNFAYRFDFLAKLLYAKHNSLRWYKGLYINHILTLNGGCEAEPLKTSEEDFVAAFDLLIKEISETKEFNAQYPIPIGTNYLLLNGAHRMVLCFLLKINPVFVHEKSEGLKRWSYKYFKERLAYPVAKFPISNPAKVLSHMEEEYLDRMALEYCLNFENFRVVCVYPAAKGRDNEVEDMLQTVGIVYYKKEVSLNELGLIHLTYELYRGEGWIGGFFPNNESKGLKCYGNNKLRVFLLLPFPGIDMQQIKKQIRDMYGINNHSVHIHDTYEEGLRIAKTLFNENSIHFLRYSDQTVLSLSEKATLEKYYQAIQSKPPLERENYCIDASFVLGLYGIRNSRNLDYCSLNTPGLSLQDSNIAMHVDSESVQDTQELILNPNYHFYTMGLKVTCIKVVKETKVKRNEVKDQIDVTLINQFLNKSL